MKIDPILGTLPVLVGRQWWRGAREMRDPFEQARRNRYALLDAIEDRTRKRIHRRLFTHGDAVVFPHAVTERSNAATEERLKSGHAVGGLSIV